MAEEDDDPTDMVTWLERFQGLLQFSEAAAANADGLGETGGVQGVFEVS